MSSLEYALSDKPSSVGHHFVIGLSGARLDATDKLLLKQLRPGGILLLKRNFLHTLDGSPRPYREWLPALKELISETRKYAERDDLLITIDHEGGRVVRTPPPFSAFPYAARYASRAAEVAEVMAAELRSIGVNVSWSPVADIHSNPANPVIGERAFGTSADGVAETAITFAKALGNGGVLACAKHFPGHGDTQVDSHLDLPSVDKSLAELRAVELRPFKALVDAGIPLVMTAHIIFPQIDPGRPATLSRRIMHGLLRDELGFKETVVSDDLDMKAIASHFKVEEVMRWGVEASCDLFLVSRFLDPNSDHPLTIAKALIREITARTLHEDHLHASFLRLQRLFAKAPVHEVQELPENTWKLHAELTRDVTG